MCHFDELPISSLTFRQMIRAFIWSLFFFFIIGATDSLTFWRLCQGTTSMELGGTKQISTFRLNIPLLYLSRFALQDLQSCLKHLCSAGKPQSLGLWLPAEWKHVRGGPRCTIPGHRYAQAQMKLRSPKPLCWTSAC